MKHLPSVTLISYDNSDDPSRTLKALRYCTHAMQFATVVLVCRVIPEGLNGDSVHLVEEKGYQAAMQFEVTGINHHVVTDYALCIHHDGYIINPGAWRNEWLKYDFIGAPWPRSLCSGYPTFRVGNTGFCLKSKAFMQYCAELGESFDNNTPGDVFACQTIRPIMENYGMCYAPLDVAAAFSWELNIEEYPLGRPDAFGFHGWAGKFKS